MKILFINSLTSYFKDTFPLGLVSLCTILKNNSIECDIIDYNYILQSGIISSKNNNINDITIFVDYIISQSPNVVSFYTMSNSYEFSITIAKILKRRSPNIFIIFAGPQASACPVDTIKLLPFVDLVAIGEGELTILDLLNGIYNNKYYHLPNICCFKDGEIILNRNCDLVANLDLLPMLDYSFVNEIGNFNSIPIEVGRGCPFSCAFCSTKTFWKQNYRLKSVNRIIEEIKYIVNKYSIKKFSLEHDSLTANRTQIINLCNMFIDAKMDITWGCSSRVDVLDQELINIMYKAGCRSMFLGIESGSSKIQKEINKNLSIEKIKTIIPLLNKKGISIRCSFIYGFPFETSNDIIDTLSLIEFLLSNNINDIQIYKFTVLFDTEFYFKYKDRLKISSNNKHSYFTTGINPSSFQWAINKYPQLFPQYCEIDKVDNNNLQYIQCFINYFLNILFVKLKNTANYLKQKYNNLYNLYIDMIEFYAEVEKIADKLLYNNIDVKCFEIEIVDSFLHYINYIYSGKDKDFLYTLILFDRDIITLYYSNRIITNKTYEYDILLYLRDNKYIIQRKTKVKFIKKEHKLFVSSNA